MLWSAEAVHEPMLVGAGLLTLALVEAVPGMPVHCPGGSVALVVLQIEKQLLV
jgi:hypothetical protein